MLKPRSLAAKNSFARGTNSPASTPSSRRKAPFEITGWVELPAPKSQPGPASIAAPGSSSKNWRELSRRLRWARCSGLAAKLDAAALGHGPVRVVGDLPGMAIGIDEDPAVAAPEGLGRLTADRRAGAPRLLDRRVHLRRRVEVERQGDAAPATAVGDRAVLGQAGPVPEGEGPFA